MKDVLKNLPAKPSNEYDIMSDIRYIRKACSLVTDALKRGCSVLQDPEGDIEITEVRTVTFRYTWNDTKTKFEKVKSGSRLRRLRSQKALAETKPSAVAGKPQANAAVASAQAAAKAAPVAKRQQKVLEAAD